MKIDLHTHNSRCGHAIGKIREYIDFAILNNVNVIGITDHMPYFCSKYDHLMPKVAMAKSEFDKYINEVLELKKEYDGKIEVLLSLEADYSAEYVETYDKIFRQYPFDYIICSVHISNGLDIYNKKRWETLSIKECYRELEIYYNLVNQLVMSNYFDVIGHLDAIKTHCPVPYKDYFSIIERTLEVIAKQDIVIEINTSGKIKEINEWFPVKEVIEKAYYLGIKVTFASDAHVPERVADGFTEVISFLKDLGYREIAIFKQRKRIMIPL